MITASLGGVQALDVNLVSPEIRLNTRVILSSSPLPTPTTSHIFSQFELLDNMCGVKQQPLLTELDTVS